MSTEEVDPRILLWLDDVRNPYSEQWNNYIAKNIDNPLNFYIIWVTSMSQFVKYITDNGIPYLICFDHDLSFFELVTNKKGKIVYKEITSSFTGYDAAKWLTDYCMNNNVKLPRWHVQSANPVGAENITKLLENYEKFTTT